MISLRSQVIVTQQPETTIDRLRTLSSDNERIEIITPEETKTFSVKDAARAIEKAHMASYEHKVIVLVADVFSEVVQNKLLKAIEEPPPKCDFILVTASKATLLPTIRSRLPITVLDDEKTDTEPFELNLSKLDLGSMYAFVQEHKRIDAATAKPLLERIATEAIGSGRYRIDEGVLDWLRDARLALDKGSPPSFVLIGVLLKLMAKQIPNRPTHP
jgi:DNA polymerase-3 subunit delta'